MGIQRPVYNGSQLLRANISFDCQRKSKGMWHLWVCYSSWSYVVVGTEDSSVPKGRVSTTITPGPDAFFLFIVPIVHIFHPPIITMFSRTTIVSALVLLLAGQAIASPIPISFSADAATEALKTIPVYVKRQIPAEVAVKSPNGQVVPYTKRQIPAEVAVKAPNGQVVPYSKRQIPAEVAVKSPNGQVVPYTKRQIPAEIAVKAPNGQVVPYSKRQIPAELAVKSPNGQVVPYTKRQIPAEVAVKAPNGQVVPYSKRQIPAELAVKSPNGQVVPY